jgi:hypothetical protein
MFGLNDVAFLGSLQPPALTDPFFANVSLLLHGDGANGSTTIIDSSPSPKSVTAVGNAQISTAQSKFGGSSISLPSAGSILTTPRASSLVPIADWTYECWFWLQSTTDPQFGQSFFGNWGAVGGDFDIRKNGNTLTLYCYNSANFLIATISAPYTFVAQTWEHLAITRQGDVYRFFFNGQLANAVTNANPVFDGTDQFTIGHESNGSSRFTGFMDEIRVTSGIARYTANFTPPTAPFPDA